MLNDEILTNQELLGYLVDKCRSFRVRIGEAGIFRPDYCWVENELDVDTIVGTIVTLFNRPNLILSRVHTLWLPPKNKKGFKIGTTLILHNGDNRDLDELPISGLKLILKDIKCIFEKE